MGLRVLFSSAVLCANAASGQTLIAALANPDPRSDLACSVKQTASKLGFDLVSTAASTYPFRCGNWREAEPSSRN